MDIAISEANNGKQQILFVKKTKLTQGGTSSFCTQRLGVPIIKQLYKTAPENHHASQEAVCG